MEETPHSVNSVQFPLPQKNVQDPWNFIFSPDTVKKVAIKDLKCIKWFEAFKLGLRKLYPHPLTHNWSPHTCPILSTRFQWTKPGVRRSLVEK